MPPHSSKQLQRGVSGLDMSIPMALQDLQADYFSDEDPAYSSFSGMLPNSVACQMHLHIKCYCYCSVYDLNCM